MWRLALALALAGDDPRPVCDIPSGVVELYIGAASKFDNCRFPDDVSFRVYYQVLDPELKPPVPLSSLLTRQEALHFVLETNANQKQIDAFLLHLRSQGVNTETRIRVVRVKRPAPVFFDLVVTDSTMDD